VVHHAILHAQAQTLTEWADAHEHSGIPGSSETAFLFRRAARMCARMADGKAPESEPDLPVPEPDITTPKDG
jgi:hypothetical protein